MTSVFDTFPAADAWPEPDPRRAVLLLFTTGTTGTTAPRAPRARGTAGLLLASASRVRPTVRP
ncbi:hypothetical protein ACWCQ0_19815 [Streptomyces massasporeus]